MEILYFLTGKIYHSHFHYVITNVIAKMVLIDERDIFQGRIINSILAFFFIKVFPRDIARNRTFCHRR